MLSVDHLEINDFIAGTRHLFFEPNSDIIHFVAINFEPHPNLRMFYRMYQTIGQVHLNVIDPRNFIKIVIPMLNLLDMAYHQHCCQLLEADDY